jgi:hypothetical protein
VTVSAQTPINRSTGNGVTTVFPYTFKIISDADIEVSVDDVVKTLTVDYTVSGAGADAGGNVTMLVAPASSTSVLRRRNMALVRTTDYQDQGELPATTLDSDLDAAILMIQQVDDQIGRALTLPAGVTGVSAELPEPEPNAVFVWNTAGDGIENKTLVDLGALALPLSVSEGGTGSITAAAARTVLGLAIGTDVQAYDADTAKTDVAQSFTAAQRGAVSALADGATITPDFALANNFSLTIGGNRTLANPTNLTAGQGGVIVITQDATGSRTLAYGSYWKFPSGTAPTLTTTAAAVDVLAYQVESATRITARLVSDVK